MKIKTGVLSGIPEAYKLASDHKSDVRVNDVIKSTLRERLSLVPSWHFGDADTFGQAIVKSVVRIYQEIRVDDEHIFYAWKTIDED